MNIDLDEIEKRATAATPGRLLAESYVGEGMRAWLVCSSASGAVLAGGVKSEADAEFIAHAREDVVALVARVRELETALAAVVMSEWNGDALVVALEFPARVTITEEMCGADDDGVADLRCLRIRAETKR